MSMLASIMNLINLAQVHYLNSRLVKSKRETIPTTCHYRVSNLKNSSYYFIVILSQKYDPMGRRKSIIKNTEYVA